MIITLDAFSGRPNPSWRISDKEKGRLLERVAGRALMSATETEVDAPLGPRGFIVSAVSDDQLPEDVPQAFRVGMPAAQLKAGAESRSSAFSASESDELIRFLLNTGRHVLEEDLMAFLASSTQKQAPQQAFDETVFPEPAEAAPEEDIA